MRIILLIHMETIVVAIVAAVMALLASIVAEVSTIVAATDNNTDTGTRGVGNDSSSEIAAGSSGNEIAKSGINTTVCGPDAEHACLTASGGQ
jgi:hypothetical protein